MIRAQRLDKSEQIRLGEQPRCAALSTAVEHLTFTPGWEGGHSVPGGRIDYRLPTTDHSRYLRMGARVPKMTARPQHPDHASGHGTGKHVEVEITAPLMRACRECRIGAMGKWGLPCGAGRLIRVCLGCGGSAHGASLAGLRSVFVIVAAKAMFWFEMQNALGIVIRWVQPAESVSGKRAAFASLLLWAGSAGAVAITSDSRIPCQAVAWPRQSH